MASFYKPFLVVWFIFSFSLFLFFFLNMNEAVTSVSVLGGYRQAFSLGSCDHEAEV